MDVPDRTQTTAVSLEGEVVEILQRGEVYSLRLLLLHHVSVCNVPSTLVTDVHLGDRIAIDGVLRVESVQSLPDVDRAARTTPPGLETDQ